LAQIDQQPPLAYKKALHGKAPAPASYANAPTPTTVLSIRKKGCSFMCPNTKHAKSMQQENNLGWFHELQQVVCGLGKRAVPGP